MLSNVSQRKVQGTASTKCDNSHKAVVQAGSSDEDCSYTTPGMSSDESEDEGGMKGMDVRKKEDSDDDSRTTLDENSEETEDDEDDGTKESKPTKVLSDPRDIRDVMFFIIAPNKPTKKPEQNGYYVCSHKKDQNTDYHHKTPRELEKLKTAYQNPRKKTYMVHPDLIYLNCDVEYTDGVGSTQEMNNWMDVVMDAYGVLKSFVEEPLNEREYLGRGGASHAAFQKLKEHILAGTENQVKQKAREIKKELKKRIPNFTP